MLGASISGTTPLTLATRTRFVGEDAYDESGSAVASAGDVDGDGLDDLLIGAGYADNDGLYYVGRSYLVKAEPCRDDNDRASSSADYILWAKGLLPKCTWMLAACDVDGDGLADIPSAPRVPARMTRRRAKPISSWGRALAHPESLIWRMQTTRLRVNPMSSGPSRCRERWRCGW